MEHFDNWVPRGLVPNRGELVLIMKKPIKIVVL